MLMVLAFLVFAVAVESIRKMAVPAQVSSAPDLSENEKAIRDLAEREKTLRSAMDPKSFDSVYGVARVHAMWLTQVRFVETKGVDRRAVFDDRMRDLIAQCRRLAKTDAQHQALARLESGEPEGMKN